MTNVHLHPTHPMARLKRGIDTLSAEVPTTHRAARQGETTTHGSPRPLPEPTHHYATGSWAHPPSAPKPGPFLDRPLVRAVAFVVVVAMTLLVATAIGGKALPQTACDSVHFPVPCLTTN